VLQKDAPILQLKFRKSIVVQMDSIVESQTSAVDESPQLPETVAVQTVMFP
jgi:hypothetical protein